MDIKTHIVWGNEVFFSQFKYDESEELKEILSSQSLLSFLKKLDNDTLVVLWGDGTFLEVIQQNYLKKKPFLWINFWNKGFLLNDVSILQEPVRLEVRKYPLLEMSIGESVCAVALNEFDIKAWDWKMLDLNISISETHKISLLWDGVLVSTPIGSTGYNSSLGGPILPHALSSYILTPKAPWKPKGLAPIILSNKETLRINTQWRHSPIELYADWRRIEKYNHENFSLMLQKSMISVEFLVSCEQSCSWDFRVLEEQGFYKSEN